MFFEKRGARLECIHPPITNNIHFPSKRKKAEYVKKAGFKNIPSKDQCFYSDFAVNTESGSDTAIILVKMCTNLFHTSLCIDDNE